jgi:hypothetical protein
LVNKLFPALLAGTLLLTAQPPVARKTPAKTSAKKAPGPAPALKARKLIVISIDGLDSRFLREAERFRMKIPTLRRMAANGLSADVVGLAPTQTWPAHAVISTGVPPDQNGVIDNFRPDKPGDHFWYERDLKATPIWVAAAQMGLKTAAIYWPSTVDGQLTFNCPEYWEGPAANAIPFDQITPKCTPGLIDRVSRWDNSFVEPLWDDAVGIDVMHYLVLHEKPDLILLHLPELDAEQHETGAMSIYARKVLENDDDLLGTALQKLPADTVVAIVSDHGFDTALYVVRPNVMLKAAGLGDPAHVKYGLIGVSTAKAASVLRRSIGVPRSGIAREVPMSEVRRLAPAEEVRNWVAAFDTSMGYVASDEVTGRAVSAGNHKGVHGLWPTHDSSRATLILSGEGIKRVRLPEISMLDVAPTFAEILGVKLPKAKGTSVLGRTAK